MRPYLRSLYCMWAILLVFAAAAAQQPAPASAYTTFIRGTPVGREDVTVRSDTTGVTITSSGRLSVAGGVTIDRAELRYAADGSPQLFTLNGTAGGGTLALRTTVANGTATTESGQAAPVAQTISPHALLHANGLVASYVALARRLGETAPGTELPLYIVPQVEIDIRVTDVQNDRMQLGTEFLNARRYEIVFVAPESSVAATITTGVDGNLLSVRIPSQNLDIVRADLASTATRTQIHSNPGDEAVTIAATGFNIGATLTRPREAAPGSRLPAVILLGTSNAEDRDAYLAGIPIIGQLAGALADAGFAVIRYDKRGDGQSGGRAESASMTDYADDARIVMRWLAERKDIDPRRIAVVGHGDGAWVALLAAARERRFAAVATLASPSSSGTEFVLEQQQHALDRLSLSGAERARRITLQQQIAKAVQSGKGLEDLPTEVRREADTPWFQSLLNFRPARVLEDVRQPLLIVHGALDRQVPVAHADRLAQLAREESDSESVEVLIANGVNHLLVPAATGEPSEYGALKDRNVSAAVSTAVAGWLTRTFAAIK